MKLSVVIADKKAGPSAFVVWRGISESILKASKLGYDGVELALRSKDDVDVSHLRQILSYHRMEISSISTGQVFADYHLYLTDSDQKRRQEAIQILKGIIQIASEFGGLVNLGRVRGFVDSHQTELEAKHTFTESLFELSAFAEGYGVKLIVEPVNRYELNFLNTVEQCVSLIEEYSIPNVSVMPDTFHMNIEEANIGRTLEEFASHILYIHFADSNRRAPGEGHLDFGEVFQALENVNYGGWGAVEILPIPDPDTASAQAVRFLRPFVDRLK